MISTIKKITLILATFALLATIVSCSEESPVVVAPQTPPSSPTNNNGNNEEAVDAPSFTLTSLSGSDISLSDYNDKVVVLFFFGNTCSSCRAVASMVESQIFQPNKDNSKFRLVGLDQWDGNKASVEAFQASTKVTFPLLLKASAVASDYETTYDRLVVINKEGKIVFVGKQNASSDVSTVVSQVKDLL